MLDLALAISRIVVGFMLFAHGTQQFFGWFGGPGLAGMAGFFTSIGIRPARLVAILVALAETLGGLGLAVGLATPIAAAAISAVMLGAIALIHWPRLWATDQGIEYPLVILAIAAQFGLSGPGAYALDPLLGLQQSLPTATAYLAGFVAAVAIVLAVALTRQMRQAAQEAEPDVRAA